MKPVTLDTIDKKTLIVLLRNGRIATTELASVINQNYPTVRNRLNKLVESGVIKHFYPVLQIPGIGARRYMGVYITLKNATQEKQQEIVKKLCSHPFLIEVSELEGRWTIGLLLVCNYVKESQETLNFIQQICGEYLTDLVVMPTYTISNLNRQFFSEIDFVYDAKQIKTGYSPLILKTPLVHLPGALELGGEDVKLLDYIKLQARDSLEDIAEVVKVDPKTVDYKLKKYIADNLIKYFTIEVDSSVLGYEEYLLFLNLRGSAEGKEKLIHDLKKIKEGIHYFEYLNYWEVVVTFCVRGRAEMHKVFAELQGKHREAIKNHEILWVIKRHKVEPYPDVGKIYRK